MSKHRYTFDKPVELRQRDGTLDGLLYGVVLDLDPAGGKGGAVEEQASLLDNSQRDGGAGEGKFDPALEVWKHYAAVMEPRSTGLDAQARAVIREALKVATLSECKRAIDGCKSSDFHMGSNERRRKYNALSQILKGKRGGRTTREQIDFFLEIADRSGLSSHVTSADPARVAQAKRDVLDAFDFPHDEQVQSRGAEARRWLEEQGWQIDSNPETGRPTFRVRDE